MAYKWYATFRISHMVFDMLKIIRILISNYWIKRLIDRKEAFPEVYIKVDLYCRGVTWVAKVIQDIKEEKNL